MGFFSMISLGGILQRPVRYVGIYTNLKAVAKGMNNFPKIWPLSCHTAKQQSWLTASHGMFHLPSSTYLSMTACIREHNKF